MPTTDGDGCRSSQAGSALQNRLATLDPTADAVPPLMVPRVAQVPGGHCLPAPPRHTHRFRLPASLRPSRCFPIYHIRYENGLWCTFSSSSITSGKPNKPAGFTVRTLEPPLLLELPTTGGGGLRFCKITLQLIGNLESLHYIYNYRYNDSF